MPEVWRPYLQSGRKP